MVKNESWVVVMPDGGVRLAYMHIRCDKAQHLSSISERFIDMVRYI